MRVSIFGLGYVGAVSAACLAREGHTVVGVDVDPHKLDLIRQGKAPIVEKNLEPYLKQAVEAGRLTVTNDATEAVHNTDISLLCVGTPSKENGDLRTDYLERVARQIGEALITKPDYHIVVIRSTVLPGTAEEIVLPILEETSGKRVNEHFGLAVNPEFLREGTAIADFYDPPFTVVGAMRESDAETVATLYANVKAQLFLVAIRTAEMIKYACNAFHALKITFANELGMLCKAEGIDSHEVMRVFCADTKLNISCKYLTPGFAFGGSCLPKDLRALTYRARTSDLQLPMLEAILPSNRHQIEEVAKLVVRLRKRRVGLFGLSFKPGTDDLRESPLVELAEQLIGKGYRLLIHDPNVSYAALYGSNKAFIEREIPHIREILREDAREVIRHAEVLVIGHLSSAAREAILAESRENQILVDLARTLTPEELRGHYVGLYW
ncbi:MAG: GDP-mannose dehydrogenase [Armatimonadetes bacterium JP3_11]|nr:MAG: GDP-mannose dehydrogenase [Armatimonadetes bacterium CP1_7O]OYT74073.1 MAG: GDP-mannose dehydrogenase [Armatimonadetes bacterium JP3_11]